MTIEIAERVGATTQGHFLAILEPQIFHGQAVPIMRYLVGHMLTLFTFSLSASTLAKEQLRRPVQNQRTGAHEWISMSWGGCTSKLSPPCWPARNVAGQALIKNSSSSERAGSWVLAACRNGSRRSMSTLERR